MPPPLSEIDHTSAQVYQRFAEQSAAQVLAESCRTTTELVGLLGQLPEADLTDPDRNPWLARSPTLTAGGGTGLLAP